MMRRIAALYVWAAGTWLLLTWTVTFEQLVTGGLVALAVALGLCAFDDVAAPWRLLDPRVLFATVRLVLVSLARIVGANVKLAYRIWAPSRPLRSGMLIVPTSMRTDGGLGGTGLITSLIVDNQITDLDRSRQELQYHAVAVPEGDRGERTKSVNGPVERLLAPIVRRSRS
ncbi:MAG TPA: Na+/H+ antiporter subunit E [Jatrophihabitantaceae bacterium]|nr:Na+/H+ antiporter subunit E [Jatrophihabitantaceae bacterium]